MTDSNAKKLELIGYLNKMTGHIWTPVEQPDAAEHPGLYEPLVRLSDAMGLVAENVALKKNAKNDEYDKCDNCGFESYVMPIETPSTDAAIAEIKAQGVDEAALTFHEKAFVAFESSNEYGVYIRTDLQQFAANLRDGRKG